MSVVRTILEDARRAARVAVHRGLIGSVRPTALPRAVQIAARRGLDVRSMHAVHAASRPNEPALVDDRRTLTWAETDAAINAVANALSARCGIGPGVAVALMMRNRVEYVLTWFACLRLGARAVHVSYDATAEELGWLLDHSGARVLVCGARARDAVAGAITGRDVRVFDTDPDAPAPARRFRVLEQWAVRTPPERARREDRAANVVYTSGTTGRPKGAVRDFAAVGPVDLVRILDALPMGFGERHLVVARLYHSGAQAFVLMATALGNTIFMRPSFRAEDALAALSRHRIHSVFVVPTMIRRWLDLDDATFAAHPVPHLRAIVSGAAAFPHGLRCDAIRRFGVGRLYDFYGATELGWITLISGHEMLLRPGSVGRAIPGHHIRIVDGDGRAVPAGEVGLVRVSDGQAMHGYLDDERATAEVRGDGWITVEDTGRLDADGYLYLAGRARDMIICGGVNLYPAEIEEQIAVDPAVREVAVVAAPHPDLGEVPVAFVASSDGPLDVDALAARVGARIARVKQPRVWHVVDALPRNATGKIIKRELRERLAE